MMILASWHCFACEGSGVVEVVWRLGAAALVTTAPTHHFISSITTPYQCCVWVP